MPVFITASNWGKPQTRLWMRFLVSSISGMRLADAGERTCSERKSARSRILAAVSEHISHIAEATGTIVVGGMKSVRPDAAFRYCTLASGKLTNLAGGTAPQKRRTWRL